MSVHSGLAGTRARPSPASAATDVSIHNAFAAECSAYFVWQTLGLVYSFERSGQPGPLTRLISCTGQCGLLACAMECLLTVTCQ